VWHSHQRAAHCVADLSSSRRGIASCLPGRVLPPLLSPLGPLPPPRAELCLAGNRRRICCCLGCCRLYSSLGCGFACGFCRAGRLHGRRCRFDRRLVATATSLLLLSPGRLLLLLLRTPLLLLRSPAPPTTRCCCRRRTRSLRGCSAVAAHAARELERVGLWARIAGRSTTTGSCTGS